MLVFIFRSFREKYGIFIKNITLFNWNVSPSKKNVSLIFIAFIYFKLLIWKMIKSVLNDILPGKVALSTSVILLFQVPHCPKLGSPFLEQVFIQNFSV